MLIPCRERKKGSFTITNVTTSDSTPPINVTTIMTGQGDPGYASTCSASLTLSNHFFVQLIYYLPLSHDIRMCSLAPSFPTCLQRNPNFRAYRRLPPDRICAARRGVDPDDGVWGGFNYKAV